MAVPVNIFLTYQAAVAGQAANVIARIYSADGTAQGTLRATITAGWVEDLDETGASCGYLNTFAADASWGAMLRIKYTISGVPGAGYDTPWMDYGAFFKEYTAYTLPIPVANLTFTAQQQSPDPTDLQWYQGIVTPQTWSVADASGNPIDLTGKSVRIDAYLDNGDGSLTGIFHHDTSPSGGITISTSTVTLTPVSADVATVQTLKYVLWNSSDNLILATGNIDVAATRLTVP